MIRFDKVTKHYAKGIEALNQVSFHLKRGEMAFLTGHSGAGKSTLLKLITLEERCNQGQVLIDGRNINRIPLRQVPLLRRSIGVIYQTPQLLEVARRYFIPEQLTVAELKPVNWSAKKHETS